MNGQINGLTMIQSQEFLKELDQIEGVKCGIYLREGLVEFKSVFTPFLIEIGKGVAIGLITAAILKFFEKNKDKPKVSIQIGTNNGTINIYNGDTKEQIDEKISKVGA